MLLWRRNRRLKRTCEKARILLGCGMRTSNISHSAMCRFLKVRLQRSPWIHAFSLRNMLDSEGCAGEEHST